VRRRSPTCHGSNSRRSAAFGVVMRLHPLPCNRQYARSQSRSIAIRAGVHSGERRGHGLSFLGTPPEVGPIGSDLATPAGMRVKRAGSLWSSQQRRTARNASGENAVTTSLPVEVFSPWRKELQRHGSFRTAWPSRRRSSGITAGQRRR
jgi:hypothetical protein